MIWYNEDFLHLAWSTPQHHSWALVFCRHQQELWQSRPELIAARAEARCEVVTHVCFLNTSALQARAVRSRDETGEAAGAHIVHPSPSKWSLLKGPTVRILYHFMNISCNFHNSRQTLCHMCIPGRRFGSAWSGWPFLVTEKNNGNSMGRAFAQLERGRCDFFVSRGVFLFSRRNSAGPKWRCAELGVSLADFNKFAKLFKA